MRPDRSSLGILPAASPLSGGLSKRLPFVAFVHWEHATAPVSRYGDSWEAAEEWMKEGFTGVHVASGAAGNAAALKELLRRPLPLCIPNHNRNNEAARCVAMFEHVCLCHPWKRHLQLRG